ncbi:hypothetical protein ACOMHN_053108 [Nucella lapillus]
MDHTELTGPWAKKATIKLKIGALFDVRASHLVEVFQTAVDGHNTQELSNHGPAPPTSDDKARPYPHPLPQEAVSIIFEPVITFVDVTDSFAVSNAMCDLIAHDVIAIVGITNASSLPTIQSYSATFHVPFLSLGSSQNVTSPAPFQLSLRPPVMAAVVDLLHHHGCSSALYMYDSDEGLMRIQDLFQAINIRELYIELDVRRIGDRAHVTEISKIIGSLHPRREMCLVLDVERLETKGVISVVQAGAPTVKDIILVTLDADIALNALLQDPESQPAGFNISGLQLVPSLQPSSPLHLHHHLHSSPSFQRWSSGLSSTEDGPERSHDVPAPLERSLEQARHSNLNSVSLSEGGRDDSRQHQSIHAGEESRSDSEKKHQSGSLGGGYGPEHKQRYHHSLLDSRKSEPPERDPDSSLGSNSEELPYQSHLSDPDSGHDPHPHLQIPQSFEPISTKQASWKPYTDDEDPEGGEAASARTSVSRSCEALIGDCLKVLTAALADLWDSLGDVLGSSSEESPEDMSIKCTNFVVEKKQYGADLMEALRLVHIQGETRYISFDTGGKREDYTLSVLTVRAGSSVVKNEGEWSSVTRLTSDAWSRDGVRSYTIFGNISRQPGRRVLLGVTE